MSDTVPKETGCETRQSDATVREQIGQKSSMAARLGIMAPSGDNKAPLKSNCPAVTGANCAINSHPVVLQSSKSEQQPAKCR